MLKDAKFTRQISAYSLRDIASNPLSFIDR